MHAQDAARAGLFFLTIYMTVKDWRRAMASVKELMVGQRGTYRGRAGELLTVDVPTEQVVFRHDLTDPPVSSDGVRGPARLSDVTISALDFVPEVPAQAEPVVDLKGPKAAVPTRAQISAVREAATKKVKGEHLSAAELEAVRDEAEAELVARMARGESA